jgi:hypothetical protein
MRTNATIPAMTQMFRDKDGQAVKFSQSIRVYAKILKEDIEVTEVLYNKVWYTVNTSSVQFD